MSTFDTGDWVGVAMAILIGIGLGVMISGPIVSWFMSDDIPTLDRGVWFCTDFEPDGSCYQWTRGHEHTMKEGAKR